MRLCPHLQTVSSLAGQRGMFVEIANKLNTVSSLPLSAVCALQLQLVRALLCASDAACLTTHEEAGVPQPTACQERSSPGLGPHKLSLTCARAPVRWAINFRSSTRWSPPSAAKSLRHAAEAVKPLAPAAARPLTWSGAGPCLTQSRSHTIYVARVQDTLILLAVVAICTVFLLFYKFGF